MWEEGGCVELSEELRGLVEERLVPYYINNKWAGRGKTTYQDHFLSCHFRIHRFSGGSGLDFRLYLIIVYSDVMRATSSQHLNR